MAREIIRTPMQGSPAREVIRTAMKGSAEIRELLADARGEMRMVHEGDYGRTEYAELYERYLNGIIQTLRWAVSEARSPIFDVTHIDEHLVFREKNAAWAIIDNDPSALTGYEPQFVTAAYRTLAWLYDLGTVHPLEFV